MTLWSSPHPKESAAVSLGQAQANESGKIKELADSGTGIPQMPSSVTSYSSDGSEDAGFEEGSIDVDMGEEDTEGIQIDCIQTLTEFEPTDETLVAGGEASCDSPVIPDSKIAIPLPAPPVHIGSGAFGGNQAYVNISVKNALPRGILDRPSSPLTPSLFWNHHSPPDSRIRAPGDVGLNNIGNTCFMNSGLQCLLHTSPLVKYFIERERFDRSITSIAYQFHSLMKHVWFGYSNAVALHDFKLVLGNKYAQFKDCRQHDCQEFLAVLLDMLHEELKIKQTAAAALADSSVDESSYVVDCTVSDIKNDKEEAHSSSTTTSTKINENIMSSSQKGTEKVTLRKNIKVNRSLEIKISKKSYGPVYKRLKLDKGKELHSTVEDDDDSDRDLSREMKRKISATKLKSILPVQTASASRSSIDLEDEFVDIENVENEAEGTNQLDADTENQPQTHVSPVQKAEEYWDKYMQENNTVVASTFQGMFKSSVICSECSFVSETYEPFMYLSLPIPRVMEKQLNVTFISMKDRCPTKVELTVHIMETVDKLIVEAVKKVDGNIWDDNAHYAVAEVVNYRVFRVLDEKTQLRNLSTNTKNIYLYELNENFSAKYGNGSSSSSSVTNCSFFKRNPPNSTTDITEENWETESSFQPVSSAVASTSSYDPIRAPVGGGVYETANSSNDHEHDNENENFNKVQCNICLEDYPRSDLKQHLGCSCVLCGECLLKSVEHFQADGGGEQHAEGTFVKCAVCLNTVECKRAFVSLEESSALSSPAEFITIPIIFKNEPRIDANNNSPWNAGLFGYPWLIRVPSILDASELIDYVESINPLPESNHKLLSVKLDGKSCGHCTFTSRCNGCELPRDGTISLNSYNSIMISYRGLSSERFAALQPSDMAIQSELGNYSYRNEEPTIDIHDCLRTFSETEHLDEQNPWFCPKCKKNQRATKALSICKFPDYLIVYLKRFVFLDQSSNKLNNRLTFPINDLDVNEYVTEGFATDVGKYNLYSCVCHFGSASVGHYTAFAKNPVTDQWHYFNDDSISERSPADAEYSSAYVLFYEKQGMGCDIPKKCITPLPELNSFNKSSSSFTDTKGSYLHSEIPAGPLRAPGDAYGPMVDMKFQVDSTSYTYPRPSTEEDVADAVDEGVGNEPTQLAEIRAGLGISENDSSVIVTSSTSVPEDDDADLDFDTEGCEADNSTTGNEAASSSSTNGTHQHPELTSSDTGGADSTSYE